MSKQTINIIRRATSNKDERLGKPDKLNILTFPTHERYETQLCKTGHNFYAFGAEDLKVWDESYAPIPKNYYILPKNSIYQGIRYDIILSQSKFGQFQTSQPINERLDLPVVSLEHTLPTSTLHPEMLGQMKEMSGDINVFISEFSRDVWDLETSPQTEVIRHSVDAELFKPSNIEQVPHVLSVVNDFANRDYCCNYSGWQRITKDLEVRLIGASEGLSEPAASLEELVEEYNKAQVFLNTSTVSPVPMSLLEAMSCGCAVVTTATCMIPEIIKHGENGMMSNDEDELRKYIEQLLEDEELRNRIGKAARETILHDFSEEDFISNWNKVFYMAYEVQV